MISQKGQMRWVGLCVESDVGVVNDRSRSCAAIQKKLKRETSTRTCSVFGVSENLTSTGNAGELLIFVENGMFERYRLAGMTLGYVEPRRSHFPESGRDVDGGQAQKRMRVIACSLSWASHSGLCWWCLLLGCMPGGLVRPTPSKGRLLRLKFHIDVMHLHTQMSPVPKEPTGARKVGGAVASDTPDTAMWHRPALVVADNSAATSSMIAARCSTIVPQG